MATSRQVSVWDSPKVYKHHEQQAVCHTRPKYRDGRRPKAVKVYTINLESRYLLVQGVPAIGVMTELVQLLALYGTIEEYRVLDEYPAEEFTEVYLFKFQKLTSARAAKRHTDEKSFYGGLLHVCYAPEYETVDDTRHKLQDRRTYVNRVVQSKEKERVPKSKEIWPLTTLRTTTHAQDTCEEEVQQNVQVPENVPEKSPSYRDNSQGFPLLPLPPQERLFCHPSYSGHSQQKLPTEDKMGSLHQYTGPSKDPKIQVTAIQQDRESRGTNNRPKNIKNIPSSHVRFLPRPAHFDSRKRKAEETKSQSLMGTSDEGGPLIGPKLPEIPKTDLQDASLNITANIIRSTMEKISSVPEPKPPEKKVATAKPRRRI